MFMFYNKKLKTQIMDKMLLCRLNGDKAKLN